MRLGVLIALVGVLAPSALAAARPHARLTTLAPATVVGSGFHANERVRVTVVAGSIRLSGVARTTPLGTFLVRFATDVRVPRCGQLAVSAIGAGGDRAGWKRPPEDCGAAPQPVGQ